MSTQTRAEQNRDADESLDALADLLAVIVENVVDEPGSVIVTAEKTVAGFRLSASVPDSEVPFLLGKDHKTEEAILRIMAAAAAAHGRTVRVEFTHH